MQTVLMKLCGPPRSWAQALTGQVLKALVESGGLEVKEKAPEE